MIKFELVNQLPYKQFLRLNTGKKTLYLGTPFLGGTNHGENTNVILNKKILIDSNVLSDIRKNTNRSTIDAFLNEAAKMKAEVSHIFAAAELFINHETPEAAIYEYYDSLDLNFNIFIPLSERDEFVCNVKNNIDQIRSNINILRDWLIIAKYIYNRKNGIKKHVIEFSEMVRYNHLPIFSFIYHVILVFFHVKENRTLYDDEFFNKVQSDMTYRETLEDEIDSLNNVARDMALLMTAVEIFYCYEDNVNDFSWIASSDATIGLILQEICIAEIASEEKKSKRGVRYTQNIAKVGLRPTGFSHKQLEAIISKYPPMEEENTLSRSDSISLKKSRLPLFSRNILKSRYQELTNA